jgi:hypothetical protein
VYKSSSSRLPYYNKIDTQLTLIRNRIQNYYRSLVSLLDK